MRTTYSLITLLSALPTVAIAQNAPVSTNKPALPGDARLQQSLPKSVDSDADFQASRGLSTLTTGQVSRVTLEGALARSTRAGQPWQAINPFAPKEFGDAYDNVSLDLRTQQPSGVVLLSIRFGKIGHGRK